MKVLKLKDGDRAVVNTCPTPIALDPVNTYFWHVLIPTQLYGKLFFTEQNKRLGCFFFRNFLYFIYVGETFRTFRIFRDTTFVYNEMYFAIGRVNPVNLTALHNFSYTPDV